MSKKILAMLLGLILAFALTACGGEEETLFATIEAKN